VPALRKNISPKKSSKRRTPLTPALIAQVALDLLDAQGLENFSVRRLGAQLGVEGMALYKHYDSKEMLLEAVAERLILELTIPAIPAGNWKERARKMGNDYRAISRRHPKAFPVLASRKFSSPSALALLDRIFFALLADGIPAVMTLELFRTVVNYCNGTILDELAGFDAAKARKGRALEIPREMTGLKEVERWLGPESFDAIFDVGLSAVLDGFDERLKALLSAPAS
jgi:AcrR family transcriptional regulator